MVETIGRIPSDTMIFRKLIQYILLILIIIGITIAIAFALGYSGIVLPPETISFEVLHSNDTNQTRSYRLERLKSAISILENIDENINPCDDFYTYACGTFINATRIPRNAQQVSVFTRAYTNSYNLLHASINQINKTNDIKPFDLVHRLYAACININAIEADGIKPIMDLLEKFGGWPIYKDDNWNETSFTWEKLLYDLHTIGVPMSGNFMVVSVLKDVTNSTNSIVQIERPKHDFTIVEILNGFNETKIRNYYKYMIDITKVLNIKRGSYDIKNELMDLLKFEMKLYEFAQSDQSVAIRLDFDELKSIWSTIDWETLLEKTMKFNTNINLVVTDTVFLSAFEQLIRLTPKRVQHNFVLWKAIEFSIPYLNNEIREVYNNYKHLPKDDSNRHIIKCLTTVKQHLQLATDALYVRKNVKRMSKIHVDEMVNNIRNQLVTVLSTVEWLDDKTRANALQKAIATFSIVGYSEELLDDNKLTEYYKHCKLEDEDSYLQIILNVRIFNRNKVYKRLWEPFNQTDWTHMKSFIDVNAYNMLDKNIIVILSGILQDAFFNIDRSKYLNYGSIGSVIGHELFHSFDNRGSQYDKDGKHVDWWTDETKKKFFDKTNCFVNQYNNFKIEAINKMVNGSQSLGENIADSSGIRISYLAYKNWVKMHGTEAHLPELPFTSNQLFWISLANLWCSVDSPLMLQKYATDPHPPNNFRVRGSLANIPEFSNDFQCPVGSNMNPKNKCTLW